MENRKEESEFSMSESFADLVMNSSYRYNGEPCHFMVPEDLKKWNEDAYVPRVVSIGPLFRGKAELHAMEEVKLSSTCYFLEYEESNSPRDILKNCSKAMWEADEAIREYYRGNLKVEKLTKLELAQIMVVDGCFLLGLIASMLQGETRFSEKLDNDDVMSDLMLLENQIPFPVLYQLFNIFFPTFEQEHEATHERINKHFLSILGYPPIVGESLFLPRNIVDLVCATINQGMHRYHAVLEIIDVHQTRKQKQLKLKRCALRLLTAGVTIQHEDEDSNGFGALSCFTLMRNSLRAILLWLSNIFVEKGDKHMDRIPEAKVLNFNFKFQNRKLVIKQLHITKTTKLQWCNLIALEHQKSQIMMTTSDRGSNCTSAALIFNDLICSEDDVQFLKDKKIVVDHLKMSNQELMEFFRKIALGIDHKVAVDSSYYIQVVDDINNFSKGFFIKRIWSIVWNSFKYRQEWLLEFLNRGYNFAATVISLCTVVQTVYAIISYQLPK